MMFLGLRKLGNICCGHKMFLNKIRNIFCVPNTKVVYTTNVARAGKRGNICVSNNVSLFARAFSEVRAPIETPYDNWHFNLWFDAFFPPFYWQIANHITCKKLPTNKVCSCVVPSKCVCCKIIFCSCVVVTMMPVKNDKLLPWVVREWFK